MNRHKSLLGLALLVAAAIVQAAATVGQPAPAFTAVDTAGRSVSLADFKGKFVMLEWVNPHCPFVKKHYGGGNMQGTQKDVTTKGVVWLTVNSTNAKHREYMAPTELTAWMTQSGANASATLMDADGRVGMAYGARTTPQHFLIDPKGTLVYAGAIDSRATANPADIADATNYAKLAVAEALAGKPLTHPATRTYGCTIKYPG